MKKILILAASVAALTAIESCKKEMVASLPPVEPATLSVSITGTPVTRASEPGTEAENSINTVDVLVFFAGGSYSGRLDAFGHFTGGPYSVNATTGTRKIYAVVNSPVDLSSIGTEAELLAVNASLTSQKSAAGQLSNFTMIGSRTTNLTAGVNAISVDVSRFVSRVRIGTITRDFASDALASQSFSVDAVFLSNIVTTSPYSLSLTPLAANFANKLGVTDSAYDLWAKRSVSSSLADGASVTLSAENNYLYCMPNSMAADSEATVFEPQNTKVVVECTLDGLKLYYVIPLGAIAANCSYDITELVLTRPGSADPNSQTEVSACTFTINVLPWTVVPVETELGKYVI